MIYSEKQYKILEAEIQKRITKTKERKRIKR